MKSYIQHGSDILPQAKHMSSLKEDIRKIAAESGFQLFGVSDLERLESAPFPDGRGLMRPSEVMKDARSAIVMGMVIWDEAMNSAVAAASAGDFSGGATDYLNLYYEVLETRGWRFVERARKELGISAMPTHTVQAKIAATLAGLGFIGHNTQVVTPQYGPRVRWLVVLTDADLEPDQPFAKDLCAEQPLCQKASLCVRSCPYQAIVPGPSQGMEPGKKVDYAKCVVSHEMDRDITPAHLKHIRQITERGFMECTICNLACPYGKPVDEVVKKKRGLA